MVIDALNQAVSKENYDDGLFFHSDRRVQYASYDFRDRLRKSNIIQSMSRKGNCYDNACMESFFSSLKKDLIYGTKFKTRSLARLKIVDYIETFYNSKRLHSSLGYKTPREIELEYFETLVA